MKTSYSKKNTFLLATLLVFSAFLLVSFTKSHEVWVVPAKYKTMKNPTSASKENLIVGKNLYKKLCKSCHGESGLGDGTKAQSLETSSGDFSSPEFQAQTDGEIFYKITEGRDAMPMYKKTISDDEDRWLIVNYLRTLSE